MTQYFQINYTVIQLSFPFYFWPHTCQTTHVHKRNLIFFVQIHITSSHRPVCLSVQAATMAQWFLVAYCMLLPLTLLNQPANTDMHPGVGFGCASVLLTWLEFPHSLDFKQLVALWPTTFAVLRASSISHPNKSDIQSKGLPHGSEQCSTQHSFLFRRWKAVSIHPCFALQPQNGFTSVDRHGANSPITQKDRCFLTSAFQGQDFKVLQSSLCDRMHWPTTGHCPVPKIFFHRTLDNRKTRLQ